MPHGHHAGGSHHGGQPHHQRGGFRPYGYRRPWGWRQGYWRRERGCGGCCGLLVVAGICVPIVLLALFVVPHWL